LNDNEVKIKKYNDVEDLMYGNVFGTKTEKWFKKISPQRLTHYFDFEILIYYR
jgi:hypothetical protein